MGRFHSERIQVKLTARGRRLLKHSGKSLRLEAKGTFALNCLLPVEATTHLLLER